MSNVFKRIINKRFSKLIFRKDLQGYLRCYYHPTPSYLEIIKNFSFKEGFYFTVRVPNHSCSRRKLRDALIEVLQHQATEASKYQRLDEEIMLQGLYSKFHVVRSAAI